MRNFMKWIKKYFLFLSIMVLWIALSVSTVIAGKDRQIFSKERLKNPLFLAWFEEDLLDDSVDDDDKIVASDLTEEEQSALLAEIEEQMEEDADPDSAQTQEAQQGENEPTQVQEGEPQTTSTSAIEQQQPVEKPKKVKPKYVKYKKTQVDSPWYRDPGKIPLTTKLKYSKVKNSYFKDAVFIGDSRTVGLRDYSGLEHTTYFAKTGLTIYNMLDEPFITDPVTNNKVTISYMMQHNTYQKIYLCIGINELGTGGTERFQQEYWKVLKKLRKWQPDAIIYVQSILPVSAVQNAKDAVINNTNIRDKNVAIAQLIDGIQIIYLNINEVFEDENHNLRQEYTFDNVHLYAQYYSQWIDYLKKHAVVKESTKEKTDD